MKYIIDYTETANHTMIFEKRLDNSRIMWYNIPINEQNSPINEQKENNMNALQIRLK